MQGYKQRSPGLHEIRSCAFTFSQILEYISVVKIEIKILNYMLVGVGFVVIAVLDLLQSFSFQEILTRLLLDFTFDLILEQVCNGIAIVVNLVRMQLCICCKT
jgi:hypothetical protein